MNQKEFVKSRLSCNSNSDSIAREVAEVLVEKHNWTSMETALKCCEENIDKIDKLYQRGYDLEHVAKEFDRLEGYSKTRNPSIEKEVVDYIRKNTIKKNKYGDRLVKTENGKYFMASVKDDYPYIYYHDNGNTEEGSYTEFGYGVEISGGNLSDHWKDMKSGNLESVLVPEDYLGPIKK